MAEKGSTGSIDIDSVSIREVTTSDLEAIYQLWKTDHWEFYGRKTLAFMSDQDVCIGKGFVAEIEGEIIGSAFAFKVSDQLGELGGLFVKPGYRKIGVAKKMWDVRMEYLGDRNVIVFGLGRRAVTNRKLGITNFSQQLYLYIGIPTLPEEEATQEDDHVDKIIAIHEADFDQLLAYDSTIVRGIERKKYLKTSIDKYSIRGYVAYKAGKVVGYIDEMPADGYAVVGPWYAESHQVARVLLRKFLADLPRDLPVHFVVPVSNEPAIALIEGLGLERDPLLTDVLFSREALNTPWDRMYSVRCLLACPW